MSSQSNGELWHTLSRQIAAGDRTAFERAHRILAAPLRQMLVRWSGGQRALAEELAASAWMQAWRAVCERRYDPDRASFVTFVYAIAHRLWLRQRRQWAVRQRIEQKLEQQRGAPRIEHPDPADDLHDAELIDAVREALRTGCDGRLEPQEAQVLRGLSEGHSERALAARLGVAASTVHARKQSGLRKLGVYLQRRGLSGLERETRTDE